MSPLTSPVWPYVEVLPIAGAVSDAHLSPLLVFGVVSNSVLLAVAVCCSSIAGCLGFTLFLSVHTTLLWQNPLLQQGSVALRFAQNSFYYEIPDCGEDLFIISYNPSFFQSLLGFLTSLLAVLGTEGAPVMLLLALWSAAASAACKCCEGR